MADTIDNAALASLLAEEERLAQSYCESEYRDDQETALDYYDAKPFGDEEDGRSQVVAPDVAEVVDYMAISVLRTCVSGDRVVEFEANEESQVEAAAEATEAVSYAFMRQQDGYRVLTDWVQSGLVEKIGVIKTACIEEDKRKRQRLVVTEDELAYLMESETPPVAVTEQAGDDGSVSYVVDVVTNERIKRYVDFPLPSEEFIFAERCRSEDDNAYKCHRTRKTLSELIEMGFDRDVVEGLPNAADEAYDTDTLSQSRYGSSITNDDSRLPGMRKVWLREEYVAFDYDGDGIAELLQVFRVGSTILSVQEVEENPFVVFCPFPRAHRLVGNSLADKVMDIQRIRSVIMRQTLDGIYLTNNPRMWVPDSAIGDTTIDDLLTVRPGGLVRGKAGGKPEPLYEAFDIQRGLGMLEFMVGERESRTGITRLNQGLDADALNKTATGTALMQAQGQQMEEYIARNFAEAMSRLFMKKLRLMIENGDPIAVRIEGGFKTVDPSGWSPDMDVSIRVGLGSGRKEQRLLYRNELMAMQREGLMAGLVEPKHIYANVSGMIRDAALGNPQDFWTDPDSPDAQAKAQQPQPPSPEEQKAQAEAQAQQAKLALEQQKAAADIQVSQEKNAATIEAQREKAALDMQLAREKAQAEYELAQQKMELEAQLAREKMAIEAEIAREAARITADAKAKAVDGGVSSYRPGGDLSE